MKNKAQILWEILPIIVEGVEIICYNCHRVLLKVIKMDIVNG